MKRQDDGSVVFTEKEFRSMRATYMHLLNKLKGTYLLRPAHDVITDGVKLDKHMERYERWQKKLSRMIKRGTYGKGNTRTHL